MSLAEKNPAHANQPFSIAMLTEKDPPPFPTLAEFRNHYDVQSYRPSPPSGVVPKRRRFVCQRIPFIIEAAARMMVTPGFSTIRRLLNLTNEDLISADGPGK